VAAPGPVHSPAKPSVAQLTTDVGHQLTSRSDSARVRARRARSAADRAWAEAYVLSMTNESWSASSSGRLVLPPLAGSSAS